MALHVRLEEFVAFPCGSALRGDAAVYHDPDDDAAGFRDAECYHVSGRRSIVRRGKRGRE